MSCFLTKMLFEDSNSKEGGIFYYNYRRKVLNSLKP